MNNVLAFPTKTTQGKTLIEKSIKDLLDNKTTDEKAKSELTERLLAIFETYQQDYSFDFSIECPPTIAPSDAKIIEASVRENCSQFEELIHNHMNKILLERFQAEIKLYFLECGDDCLLRQ